MSRQIICTVGTSVLTHRGDRSWAGWNPRAPDPLARAADVELRLASADLVKASAETNTLRALELSESAHAGADPMSDRSPPSINLAALLEQRTIKQVGG